MRFIVVLGRFFYSIIFILSGLGHFSANTMAYAASEGVPMTSFLVPFSGVLAILGGLSILLGFKARYGAWLIVIFLVPITVMMHKFWAAPDPMMMAFQQAMFAKNLSMLGGALLISYFGSGPLSVKE